MCESNMNFPYLEFREYDFQCVTYYFKNCIMQNDNVWENMDEKVTYVYTFCV